MALCLSTRRHNWEFCCDCDCFSFNRYCITASGEPAALIRLETSAGLEEPSREFLCVDDDPIEMADMAESMDEFLGGAFTSSILEDPGIVAWEPVIVETPSGFFTGSDTLLLSFVKRGDRAGLYNGQFVPSQVTRPVSSK